jgi:hypothetical protein
MTTDGSGEAGRPGDGAHQDGAHQGPGRWARRGAAGIGLPPGESVSAEDGAGSPPTADHGDPDISPSLAGGHAGSSRRDQD